MVKLRIKVDIAFLQIVKNKLLEKTIYKNKKLRLKKYYILEKYNFKPSQIVFRWPRIRLTY